MPVKILLTGIPGTGKTTIGDYLRDTKEYLHINMEDQTVTSQILNIYQFVDELANNDKNIVVTWGFVPNESQTDIVLYFRNRGFSLIWLDGNREAARAAFNKRGDVSEELFELQLKRINEFDVIQKILPTTYNSFKNDSSFKDISVISKELLLLAL
ncbi:MAG: hypothetical protein J0L56_14950 [Chitinophagales bacterium]|nr:hypothetical protein [Chitinophagales bacterium]